MKPGLPEPRGDLSVNIVLFDAFSNMLLACLLEPLRVVRGEHESDVIWTVLTPHDRAVQSSSGLSLSPDRPLSEAGPCGVLMLIGGDRFRTDATDPAIRRALRLVHRA